MKLNIKRHRRAVIIALLCVISVWQFATVGYIHAKAELAQWLIADAWQKIKLGADQSRPWPWADTWPVARLGISRLSVDQMVLAGASGRNLAFGPGWVQSSAMPGESGRSIIAGHRDTHFSFVQLLNKGDEIDIENISASYRYRISDTQIVDSTQFDMVMSSTVDQLILVTCYPFDAVDPGGALRYLVVANRID